MEVPYASLSMKRFFSLQNWMPAVLYWALFYFFQPQLWGKFSTHFFHMGGDGHQNVWNLWWVYRSVTELHVSPWFTSALHVPSGVTLLGQTLNPFNGFLSIPLRSFLSLAEVHNTIVVFSFVVGGLTMFWLCYKITSSYIGSLIGGAIFTFSSFHFMHALGHLQLVSLEWIPLFLLFWMNLIEKPTWRKGIGAAFVLFLVLLCDYYYVLYSVIAAVLYYGWTAMKKKDRWFLLKKDFRIPFFVFLVSFIALSGPLLFAFLRHALIDPFGGAHDATIYAMDLLFPFGYGPGWKFWHLLEPIWKPFLRDTYNAVEMNVYLPWSAIILGITGWVFRKKIQVQGLTFWVSLSVVFFLLSLGPILLIAGHVIRIPISLPGFDHPINILQMPYGIIERLVPIMRLSGMPVRMMVMVHLAIGIIVAAGWIVLKFIKRPKWRAILATAFLITLVVELYPNPIPPTPDAHPTYVFFLKELPMGSVLDLRADPAVSLFDQTVHEKPMAFGYVSRLPQSVADQDIQLANTIAAGKWNSLADQYRIRYIIQKIGKTTMGELGIPNVDPNTIVPKIADRTPIYNDGETVIFDLMPE